MYFKEFGFSSIEKDQKLGGF